MNGTIAAKIEYRTITTLSVFDFFTKYLCNDFPKVVHANIEKIKKKTLLKNIVLTSILQNPETPIPNNHNNTAPNCDKSEYLKMIHPKNITSNV